MKSLGPLLLGEGYGMQKYSRILLMRRSGQQIMGRQHGRTMIRHVEKKVSPSRMLSSIGKLPNAPSALRKCSWARRPGKGSTFILRLARNTSGNQPAAGGCTPYRTLDALMFTSYLPDLGSKEYQPTRRYGTCSSTNSVYFRK
jgi:hypothetical protein